MELHTELSDTPESFKPPPSREGEVANNPFTMGLTQASYINPNYVVLVLDPLSALVGCDLISRLLIFSCREEN